MYPNTSEYMQKLFNYICIPNCIKCTKYLGIHGRGLKMGFLILHKNYYISSFYVVQMKTMPVLKLEKI